MSLDTKLDDLAPDFKPLAMSLLSRCVENRIPVVIINTLRTPDEQAALLANGHSWTQNSRHLTGHAIDVCLVAQWELHGAQKLDWDGTDADWARLGDIGEALGLVWGGRWTQRDLGHFELAGTPAATV